MVAENAAALAEGIAAQGDRQKGTLVRSVGHDRAEGHSESKSSAARQTCLSSYRSSTMDDLQEKLTAYTQQMEQVCGVDGWATLAESWWIHGVEISQC